MNPILDLLQQLPAKEVVAAYSKHAESIFTLNHEQITAILDNRTCKTLNDIRQALLIRFSEVCPRFTVETARFRDHNSPNKDVIVQDILLLGNSIVNKGPVEHIELVYELDETVEYDLDDHSVLKQVVKDLLKNTKREMGSLKNEIMLLKNENMNLTNELTILKAQLCLDESDEIEIDCSETDKPVVPDLDNLPVSEEKTEPPKMNARPVKGVRKTANVFIGSVQSPCNKFDIQNNIKENTSVNPKISDIHALKVKGNNLAFRVTVPKDKLHEVISESVWDSYITAEIYDPQRPQKFRVPKGNNNNRGSNKKQPFRNSKPTPHRSHRSSYHTNAWGSSSSEQQHRGQFYRDQFRPRYEY